MLIFVSPSLASIVWAAALSNGQPLTFTSLSLYSFFSGFTGAGFSCPSKYLAYDRISACQSTPERAYFSVNSVRRLICSTPLNSLALNLP